MVKITYVPNQPGRQYQWQIGHEVPRGDGTWRYQSVASGMRADSFSLDFVGVDLREWSLGNWYAKAETLLTPSISEDYSGRHWQVFLAYGPPPDFPRYCAAN